MKKLILITAAFFISLSLKAQTSDMFLESESKYSFDETVKLLTENLTGNGWKIPVVHDLQESMKKAGKDVLSIKVIELCNLKLSYMLLSKDEERLYSSLMPCRVSVYEKSDGKTYISRLNSGLLSKKTGGLVEEVMTMATKEIERLFEVVIK